MKYLNEQTEKDEFHKALIYFHIAANEAEKSKCLRAKGGSVIVQDDSIIGIGYNSPPGEVQLENCLKDSLPPDFKSDKTCCIHAEQKAILDALFRFPKQIRGSRIYFVRVGDVLGTDGHPEIIKTGKPYCTICSKLALEVGIAEFALWHDKGIAIYDTEEYNRLSFAFRP